MRITDYFIKKKIQRLVRKSLQRKRDFLTLKEAHTILVFYNLKDQEDIEPGLETLRMMHKKVLACVYVPNVLPAEVPEFYTPVFAMKDINFLGFPSESVAKQVESIKADILIDLTRRGNHVMKYLMLRNQSPFKVGLKQNDQDYYDLAIAVTDRDDIMYLFGQIIFYLKTIRTK